MSQTNENDQTKAVVSSWVEEHSDALFSWAYHKTANKEIAEDLVQETFLAAFRSFEKFQEKSTPKTWLLAILNNKINDHFRKQYKIPSGDQDGIFQSFFDEKGHWKKSEYPQSWSMKDEVHLLDNLNFRQILLECMERLPGNWFSAINLKYLEEKKGKEICQELGITDTNYWQILHRAKLQLRKCLELNWFTT